MNNSSIVVITGANRGIGLALCRAYQQNGHQVIGVCRHTSDELNRLDIETIDQIDISIPDDIERLSSIIGNRTINILINNAGILRSMNFDLLDYDAIQEQFNVNTLGPLRVVEALFDNLTSGSKIGLVSSRMGSIGDNTSGGTYGYRMSKCALNVAGKSMAVDFKPKGIAVAILHPGYVQTDMVNHNGDISAEKSAARLKQRMDEMTIDTSGTFWHSNGEILPW